MDGLLFDTERLYQREWHALAHEHGFQLGDNFASEICGKGEIQAHEVLRRYFPGCDPKEVMETCKARVTVLEETELELKKGAVEILASMKERGYLLAVASSSPMVMILKNLEKAGLEAYFDKLVSGETIPRGKPFPDIFLAAAESLGLPPEECFVFEDSLNGIEAAYAAGSQPVMIPDLVQPTERARSISKIFSDLSEAREKLIG